MDPATGRRITTQTVGRRAIPEVYRTERGGEQLKTFANPGQPTVYVPEPVSQEGYGLSKSRVMTFFVQNNLVFSLFIMFFIPVIIFLILVFFTVFSSALNAFFLGVFKRPLPHNPELYFDANCVNDMNLSDLQQADQVARCRRMRPIDRLGPPLGAPRRRS